MTRLLLIILLFLSSGPAYSERMAVGGNDEAGVTVYADSGTIRREGGSLGTTKEEIQLRLDEKMRQGATPTEVLTVLDQFNVEHSDYLNRPVLDPDLVAQLDQVNAGRPTYVNTRRIQAIVRDLKRNFPVSESIQIIFLFDEHDKFVKYELRSIFTGP